MEKGWSSEKRQPQTTDVTTLGFSHMDLVKNFLVLYFRMQICTAFFLSYVVSENVPFLSLNGCCIIYFISSLLTGSRQIIYFMVFKNEENGILLNPGHSRFV